MNYIKNFDNSSADCSDIKHVTIYALQWAAGAATTGRTYLKGEKDLMYLDESPLYSADSLNMKHIAMMGPG